MTTTGIPIENEQVGWKITCNRSALNMKTMTFTYIRIILWQCTL